MRDRCAKGSLRGTLCVEVNVLMIARCIGKLINAFLIYFYPICKADFFADVVLELARVNKVAHGGSFFCGFVCVSVCDVM